MEVDIVKFITALGCSAFVCVRLAKTIEISITLFALPGAAVPSLAECFLVFIHIYLRLDEMCLELCPGLFLIQLGPLG